MIFILEIDCTSVLAVDCSCLTDDGKKYHSGVWNSGQDKNPIKKCIRYYEVKQDI